MCGNIDAFIYYFIDSLCIEKRYMMIMLLYLSLSSLTTCHITIFAYVTSMLLVPVLLPDQPEIGA